MFASSWSYYTDCVLCTLDSLKVLTQQRQNYVLLHVLKVSAVKVVVVLWQIIKSDLLELQQQDLILSTLYKVKYFSPNSPKRSPDKSEGSSDDSWREKKNKHVSTQLTCTFSTWVNVYIPKYQCASKNLILTSSSKLKCNVKIKNVFLSHTLSLLSLSVGISGHMQQGLWDLLQISGWRFLFLRGSSIDVLPTPSASQGQFRVQLHVWPAVPLLGAGVGWKTQVYLGVLQWNSRLANIRFVFEHDFDLFYATSHPAAVASAVIIYRFNQYLFVNQGDGSIVLSLSHEDFIFPW